MSDGPYDPEAFSYDRSPGWQQRTFDEHNFNVIEGLRALLDRWRTGRILPLTGSTRPL